MATTNGTTKPQDETKPVNRLPLSPADEMDALFRKATGLKVTVTGTIGRKYTYSTEGYPEDTNAEDVAQHFLLSGGAKCGATRDVGTGKVQGAGKATAEDAAKAVLLLLTKGTAKKKE